MTAVKAPEGSASAQGSVRTNATSSGSLNTPKGGRDSVKSAPAPWYVLEEQPPNGKRSGEMRHIPGNAAYKRWDFLKGAGPSAQPRVLVHVAKDVGRFKAGWHTKKAGHVIQADRERLEQEQQKAARAETSQAARGARLRAQNAHLGFNPITGAELLDHAHKERPTREEGIKCYHRPQTPPAVRQARHQAAEAKFNARADLIRREGLAPRPATVADNFKAEHYL